MRLGPPSCITVVPSSFLLGAWLHAAGQRALHALPWGAIDRAARAATADALAHHGWSGMAIAYGSSLTRFLWTRDGLAAEACSVGVLETQAGPLHSDVISKRKGHPMAEVATAPIAARRPLFPFVYALGVHRALTVRLVFSADTHHARMALLAGLRDATPRAVAPVLEAERDAP